MPGSARPSAAARPHGRLTAAGRRPLAAHKKSLAYVGTALALAGAGSAASTATASAATDAAPLVTAAHAPAAPALDATEAAASIAVPATPAGHLSGPPARTALPARTAQPARTALPARTAQPATSRAPARRPAVLTWLQVRNRIIRTTDPHALTRGRLPYAERLMPVRTSGPQAWMPVGRAQVANATTIVREALRKRMGIRSAVIAVATAMQESRLLNIDYGDANSLGLFQQRPGFGWGSAREILNPEHAAGAFYAALRQHQAADPAWAVQPLWATAQAVQRSAVPFAYAKWETQAANLVRQVAMKLQ